MKNLLTILFVFFVLSLGLSSCTQQKIAPVDELGFEIGTYKGDEVTVFDHDDSDAETEIGDTVGNTDSGDGITDDEDDEDEDDGGAVGGVGT